VKATLASYDPSVINSATFGISLEPLGGSPTGQPTGAGQFTPSCCRSRRRRIHKAAPLGFALIRKKKARPVGRA